MNDNVIEACTLLRHLLKEAGIILGLTGGAGVEVLGVYFWPTWFIKIFINSIQFGLFSHLTQSSQDRRAILIGLNCSGDSESPERCELYLLLLNPSKILR